MNKYFLRIVSLVLTATLATQSAVAVGLPSFQAGTRIHSAEVAGSLFAVEAFANRAGQMPHGPRWFTGLRSVLNTRWILGRREFIGLGIAVGVAAVAQDNYVFNLPNIHQGIQAYLRKVADTWADSSDADEKNASPYVRQMADNLQFLTPVGLTSLQDLRLPIEVLPRHSTQDSYLVTNGLIQFDCYVHPLFFAELLASGGQSTRSTSIGQTLLNSFLIEKSKTLMQWQANSDSARIDEQLSQWIEETPQNIAQASKTRHQSIERIKTAAAFWAARDAAGILSADRYLRTHLPGTVLQAMESRKWSAMTYGILATSCYAHQKVIDSNPRDPYRAASISGMSSSILGRLGLSPNFALMHIKTQAYSEAVFIENAEGRLPPNPNGSIGMPFNAETGILYNGVMPYLNNPDYTHFTYVQLMKRLGPTHWLRNIGISLLALLTVITGSLLILRHRRIAAIQREEARQTAYEEARTQRAAEIFLQRHGHPNISLESLLAVWDRPASIRELLKPSNVSRQDVRRWKEDAYAAADERLRGNDGIVKTMAPRVGMRSLKYSEIEKGFIGYEDFEVELDLLGRPGDYIPVARVKSQRSSRLTALLASSLGLLEDIQDDAEASEALKRHIYDLFKSVDNRERKILIRVSSSLDVDAARYFNPKTNQVEIILSAQFVEALLRDTKDHWIAVEWILAERLYHELGHDNASGGMVRKFWQEFAQVRHDVELNQYTRRRGPQKEIARYVAAHHDFRSGYYFGKLLHKNAFVQFLNLLVVQFRFFERDAVKAMGTVFSGRDPKHLKVQELVAALDPMAAERLRDEQLRQLLTAPTAEIDNLIRAYVPSLQQAALARINLALDLMVLRSALIGTSAASSVSSVPRETGPAANLNQGDAAGPSEKLVAKSPTPAQVSFVGGKKFFDGRHAGVIEDMNWTRDSTGAFFQIRVRLRPVGAGRGARITSYRLDEEGLKGLNGEILTTDGIENLQSEIREKFTAADRRQGRTDDYRRRWTKKYPWLVLEAKPKAERSKRGSSTKVEDIFEAFRMGLEKEFSGLDAPLSLEYRDILGYEGSLDPRKSAIYIAYLAVKRGDAAQFGFPEGRKAAIEATREYFHKNQDKLSEALLRQAA